MNPSNYSAQKLRRLVNSHEQLSVEIRTAKLTRDLCDGTQKFQAADKRYFETREKYFTSKILLYMALRLPVPLRWWKIARDGLATEVYHSN